MWIIQKCLHDIDAFSLGSKECVAAELGYDVPGSTAGEHDGNTAEAGGFYRCDAKVLHLLGKFELVNTHPGCVNKHPRGPIELGEIIVAAEITIDAPDFGHLEPMLDTTLRHLEKHGVTEMPKVLLGDAGYWHTRQIQSITDRGIEVLIPPDGTMREGKRPGWEHGFYEKMRRKLKTKRGRKLYALRKITIEPVFGQIKYNRRVDQFMRRGRAAAHSELRLVAATHNLLKLVCHER